MQSEITIKRRLAKIEKLMAMQVEEGIKKGWPILFWDRNCVEREVLRRVLRKKRKQFCAADTMAGW
jgi:hypothetical protein